MIHAIATFFVGIAAAANAFLGGLMSPNYGTSLTTINGSDTISSSRTVINDNFTALEASKLDKTATTLPSSFLASSLTSVGTIASGVWNGTPVGVAYGGTGTTSPSTHYVMLGNGTSGLKVVSGLGTSGQFLTSNGAGAAPTWQTSAVNQNDPYTWTGTHIFSALATFNGGLTSTATTTLSGSSLTNNAIVINGLAYKWPSTNLASSTTFMNNGSGTLVNDYPGKCVVGVTSIGNTGAGDYTITHNLGVIPKDFSFQVTAAQDDSYDSIYFSNGFGSGVNNQSCVHVYQLGNNWATTQGSSGTDSICVKNGTSAVSYGSVTALTITTATIHLETSPSGSFPVMWKFCY